MRNFVITIDGKQYQVGVEEVGATASAVTPVVTEVKPVAAAPAAPANGTKVNAPMPGLIKQLSKEEGAAVKKGEVILVLEAMKMENEILAPHDGTVAQVIVSKGSTVETDSPLIVLA